VSGRERERDKERERESYVSATIGHLKGNEVGFVVKGKSLGSGLIVQIVAVQNGFDICRKDSGINRIVEQ